MKVSNESLYGLILLEAAVVSVVAGIAVVYRLFRENEREAGAQRRQARRRLIGLDRVQGRRLWP